ncbi:MAG: helix-turn-helix transcriptional regulator [Alphaproteobacteria bacterium]
MVSGKNIRNLRKAAGLTQAQLAERVGLMDHTGISKIENGKSKKISVHLVGLIAKALQADIADIMSDAMSLKELSPDFLLCRKIAHQEIILKTLLTDQQFYRVLNVLLEDPTNDSPISVAEIRRAIKLVQ